MIELLRICALIEDQKYPDALVLISPRSFATGVGEPQKISRSFYLIALICNGSHP